MSEAQAPRAPAKGPSWARPAHWRRWGHGGRHDPSRKAWACGQRVTWLLKEPAFFAHGSWYFFSSLLHIALWPAQARRYLDTCPPAPYSASCTQTSPSFLQQSSPPSSAAQQVPRTLDVDPSLPPHHTKPCLFPTTSPPWATCPPVSASWSHAHAKPTSAGAAPRDVGSSSFAPPPPSHNPNRHESRARARTCACSGASWLATATAIAT